MPLRTQLAPSEPVLAGRADREDPLVRGPAKAGTYCRRRSCCSTAVDSQSHDPRLYQLSEEGESLIAEHGWIVRHVSGTEGRAGPVFSYTIGLHETGLPELIEVGLAIPFAQKLLDLVALRLLGTLRQARPVYPGPIALDDWPGPIWLIEGERDRVGKDFALAAEARSKGEALYFQACWADTDGAFPWESRCDKAVREAQWLLGRAPRLH